MIGAEMDTPPSQADVRRIAALSDPVLRNLHITQCYYALSRAVAKRTGPVGNWCTFAAWASKQAGQTIRQEDLGLVLERLRAQSPELAQAAAALAAAMRQLGVQRDPAAILETVWTVMDPRAALDRASDAVARGNLKVFAEIGLEFARFLDECLPDPAFEAEHIARYCAALRPGDPPEGQGYLRRAFAGYYQALFEPSAQARAELLLLANLLIGYHEQTRLQPEIAEALEAGVASPRALLLDLLGSLLPYRGWPVYAYLTFRRWLGRPSRVEAALERLTAAARLTIRRALTEHMMVLSFPPGVRLRLGDDLRARFPAALQRLAHPDLLALLAQIDPTPDDLHDSGAADWGDLPDRLHFIADLFRCYADAPDLLGPPFTDEQVGALRAGRRPAGPL
jgi:hypothetical protein